MKKFNIKDLIALHNRDSAPHILRHTSEHSLGQAAVRFGKSSFRPP